MINADVLRKAIVAHSGWKTRLQAALNTGKCDVASATAKADNQCDFGKWLYGPDISAVDKQTEFYRTVKQLHAQFHQEAAKVIDWTTSGNKKAAEQSMALGGSYLKASSQLVEAITKWRDSLP